MEGYCQNSFILYRTGRVSVFETVRDSNLFMIFFCSELPSNTSIKQIIMPKIIYLGSYTQEHLPILNIKNKGCARQAFWLINKEKEEKEKTGVKTRRKDKGKGEET